MQTDDDNKKRGPKPETLKAEGVDWEDAIAHALKKKKPEEGWPEKDEEADREEKGQPDEPTGH
ncbi:MAG: hypothetical protein IID30_12585 [Planctomycetes bacterium]|nr:hypothetical protein [Planctomycetota bacterium]